MKILINDLQSSRDYTIQIRANDGADVSEWSPKYTITTLGKADNPAVVTGATWTTSGTSWLATWNPVTTNNDGSPLKDFDHYQVWITDGVTDVYYNTGATTRFDFTIEMNRAAFGVPPTSVPASPLTFRVRAKDQSGHPTMIGNGWNTPITTANAAPTAPTTVTATVVSQGVTLAWPRVLIPDVTGYRIYRGSTSSFTFDSAHLIWEGSAITASIFQDWGLTRHYYVVAVDVFGTESPGTYAQVVTPAYTVNTGDGSAPPVPGAPTLVSGIGVIFARWVPVSNNELVKYDVHVAPESSGASFAVSSSTLVATTPSTSMTIKTLSDGTPLSYTPQRYYVRVVSVDSDGASVASTGTLGEALRVTGPDIAADSVTANEIAANTITGNELSGTIILGSTISTSAPDPTTGIFVGAGVTLNAGGLTVRGPDRDLAFFPTGALSDDPTAAVTASINAVVSADGLTVTGDSNLGPNVVVPPAGIMTLRQGISTPSTKPTMKVEYDMSLVAMPTRTYSGWTKGHDGKWYTLSYDTFKSGFIVNSTIWYVFGWDQTTNTFTQTTVTGRGSIPTDVSNGIVWDGTNYYALGYSGGVWTLYRMNTSFAVTQSNVLNGMPTTPMSDAVLGIESGTVTSRGKILVCIMNSASKLRFFHFTPPASSNASLTADNNYTSQDVFNSIPRSIMYTTGDFTAGSYYIVVSKGGKFRIYDNTTTPVEDTTRQWSTRNAADSFGAWWDGTQFSNLDTSLILTRYEPATSHRWTSTANGIWWGSYAWVNTSTGERTPIGPRQKLNMTSRARLRMESPPVPQAIAGAAPNAARFFLHRGTTDDVSPWSATWAQSDGTSILITAANFSSGTHPPTTNEFTGASPSTLLTEAGGFSLSADGTGSWPLKMRGATSSVPATGNIVASTSTTRSITFSPAFLTAPIVVACPDTTAPNSVFATARNITATGFDIVAYRTTGTAAVDVNWIAIVP